MILKANLREAGFAAGGNGKSQRKRDDKRERKLSSRGEVNSLGVRVEEALQQRFSKIFLSACLDENVDDAVSTEMTSKKRAKPIPACKHRN